MDATKHQYPILYGSAIAVTGDGKRSRWSASICWFVSIHHDHATDWIQWVSLGLEVHCLFPIYVDGCTLSVFTRIG